MDHNLLIKADSEVALQYLQPLGGQVQCLYIDPPYGSTNNRDLTYNDQFPGKWLAFMRRSLILAIPLLQAKEAVLLVSINDASCPGLRQLLDELWPSGYLGSFIWQKRTPFNSAGHGLSLDHEYVLVYGRRDFRFKGRVLANSHVIKRQDLTKDRTFQDRPNSFFPLYDPERDVWYAPNPQRVWNAISLQSAPSSTRVRHIAEEMVADGRIKFPVNDAISQFATLRELKRAICNGKAPVNLERQLNLGLPIDFYVGKRLGMGIPYLHRSRTQSLNTPLSSFITPISGLASLDWNAGVQSGGTAEGTRELRQILGGLQQFTYPKPLSLMTSLLWQTTKSDSLILDFFCGSGTTAHAAMLCNQHDGGTRRWIAIDESITVAESRLRRVVDGYTYRQQNSDLHAPALKPQNFIVEDLPSTANELLSAA